MSENKAVLLSVTYLGPVQYYSKLVIYPDIHIERFDNYNKQTYRNRCRIYGANGSLFLSIPVLKASSPKILVKDVLISYDTNWQKQHWKSIESAYSASPFFEFFKDELFPFYNNYYKFLFDFNIKIQETILNLLEIKLQIFFTDNYSDPPPETTDDWRDKIHPKKKINDPCFNPANYNQVFINKYGFIPNLSIIDLLFNEGLNSINVLKESYLPGV